MGELDFFGQQYKHIMTCITHFERISLANGAPMFPEFRDLITRLKHHDLHFTRLFDKHNALDQKIKNMEAHISPGSHAEIESLKKEKLLLKDQLFALLKKHANESPQ